LPLPLLLLLPQLFWFIPSRMLWRVTFERMNDALSDEEAAQVNLGLELMNLYHTADSHSQCRLTANARLCHDVVGAGMW
jgi:hypothetical protein